MRYSSHEPRASTHRHARAIPGRRGRQRAIRSTLTVLLVIPLLSLVALWAYAASSTVGGAIAERNSDTVNKEIGGPIEALDLQLTQERAQTFIWQSAGGWQSAGRREPRAGLAAQRTRTDAAITAFRAGAAATAGAETSTARSAIAAVLGKLGQLSGIRARIDAGTIAPLTALVSYSDIIDETYLFARGALSDPDTPLALYQEADGAGDENQALGFISEEAALMGGALVSGGRMSATEHQLFVQAVDNQRLLEQIGAEPVYWPQIPDPYPQVFAAPAYQEFTALEDQIVAASPGARLPVSPAAWQSGVQSVAALFSRAENSFRRDATSGISHAGDVVLLRLFLVGGAGLAAVIVSALLSLGFGNRITRELTGLKKVVRALADEHLPAVVSRLSRGEEVDVDAEAPPLALRTRTREVTETAGAFSAVQRTAVQAAVGQAQLRKGVSNVFRSLARRNQSLLQRQLKMLDQMERGTDDPEALAQLFRLDHLTTRMRRQAEGLIILSGAAPGRGWRQPVPVVEVLRGAIGEIEDYVRVDLITDSRDFVRGSAVADLTHLLAELIENAASYSPPHTRVRVTTGKVANGYAVEVEDRGLGIAPELRAALNERLAEPPEFDLADSDQLGLFVVSRLAARLGVKVTLRESAFGGTTAIVLMPHGIVLADEDSGLPPLAIAGRNPTAVSNAGLPRRPRQAGPVPRDGGTSPAAKGTSPANGTGQHAAGSAEQARAFVASIQQGWQRGRAAADRADGNPDPGTGNGEAGQ
jgi:signal transduction histidine kinase